MFPNNDELSYVELWHIFTTLKITFFFEGRLLSRGRLLSAFFSKSLKRLLLRGGYFRDFTVTYYIVCRLDNNNFRVIGSLNLVRARRSDNNWGRGYIHIVMFYITDFFISFENDKISLFFTVYMNMNIRI